MENLFTALLPVQSASFCKFFRAFLLPKNRPRRLWQSPRSAFGACFIALFLFQRWSIQTPLLALFRAAIHYQMQTEMAANVASNSEKALTGGLLSDLERISKTAHEAIGFTYTPLEQLAALQ